MTVRGKPCQYSRGGKRCSGTVYADPPLGSLIVRTAKGRLIAVSRDRAKFQGHTGSYFRVSYFRT